MTLEEFTGKVSKIREANGPRAGYKNIFSGNGFVYFTRTSTDNQESVSIKELFELYNCENRIDTVVARGYISGRVYSPSVAILKSAGLINETGDRIGYKQKGNELPGALKISKKQSIKVDKKKKADKNDHKDETIFFKALNNYLGANKLYSKSIGLPIDRNDLYFSDDFTRFKFTNNQISEAFKEILKRLQGTYKFNNQSLAHHIDGLIHDHPIFGTRIVEFDEEQHFTPARKETLIVLGNIINLPYGNRYIAICDDIQHYKSVLKKHRIKKEIKNIPQSFNEFIEWLEIAAVSESNYIASKPAFDFKGGRIAQRAYFDSLRDIAHLSKYNKQHKLQAPLRFAKYSFEERYDKTFAELSEEEIIKGIAEILKTDYKL